MNYHILEEFMVKRGGSVDPGKFKNESFELLSIPAYDEGKPEILEGERIGSSKKVVKPSDVLLSKIVPHIRRCWIVPRRKKYRQIASGEWIQFRSDELIPGYLRYFLISDPFHSQFMNTVTGVGGSLLRASPEKVAEINIPVPPLNDQKRIAHLLGKVEGLIAQRKQHLRQLDNLLKSVFLEMFGDPVRNDKRWDKKRVSEFATVRIGPFGSLLHAEDYISGGIPLVNPSHMIDGEIKIDESLTITEEKFQELAPYHLDFNDVIVARRGEIGRCALVKTDSKLLCGTGSMFIRITGEYLPLVFQFMIFRTSLKSLLDSKAKGVTMKNLNSSILGNLNMIAPPLDLQNQFAAIVEKVRILKSRYQQSLADLEVLYGALSQKAFKGALDLSRVPLPTENLETTEDKMLDSADSHEMKPSFELPAPADLDALKDSENQKTLLNQWLIAWIDQLGDRPFDVQLFVQTTQQRLWDLVDYEMLPWGVAEYNALKESVFELLKSGRLIQTYNEENNLVEIKVTKG
jgi:type I restriction enzyme, S subunit